MSSIEYESLNLSCGNTRDFAKNIRYIDRKELSFGAGLDKHQMKISVKVKTKAKKTFIRKIDASHFVVAVQDAPEKGRANSAIIKALAGYFDVPRFRVTIVSGLTAKLKIVEVLT